MKLRFPVFVDLAKVSTGVQSVFDSINQNLRQFGISDKLSATGQVGSVTVTADSMPAARTILAVRKSLEESLREQIHDVGITVGEPTVEE